MKIEIAREIDKIVNSIPENLKKGLMMDEKIDDLLLEDRFRAEQKLKDLGETGRRKIYSDKEQNEIRTNLTAYLQSDLWKVKQVVNPKVTDEIDRYLSQKIEKAIKEGRIPRVTRKEYYNYLRGKG